MDFIKSLFTPEQLAPLIGWLVKTSIMIASELLMVLLVVLLAIAGTQLIKLVWQRAKIRGPSEWHIHATSLCMATLWSFLLIKSHSVAQVLAIALVAWFLTWLIATFALDVLRNHFPKLSKLVNMNRRKRDRGAPGGFPRRSYEKAKK